MNSIRQRKFASLAYGDPRGFLIELRKVEAMLNNGVPDKVRRLRTNPLKHWREARDAALFCVGISAIIGAEVRFAPVEDEDFDFVATWLDKNVRHFCCVQLKEVVSEGLNPSASIDNVIARLLKYACASDLTVAILYNRPESVDFSRMSLPQSLQLAGLWVFACVSPDQDRWALWGDYVNDASPRPGTVFEYPH